MRTLMLTGAMLACAAFATAQMPATSVAPPPSASAAETKPIAEADRQALLALQQRVTGLSEAQAVIQKEIDSTVAEFQRTIQRVQAAAPSGMELSPQLVYVPKKPAPAKKDEPKKDSPPM
jgi:hypothetical protein